MSVIMIAFSTVVSTMIALFYDLLLVYILLTYCLGIIVLYPIVVYGFLILLLFLAFYVLLLHYCVVVFIVYLLFHC